MTSGRWTPEGRHDEMRAEVVAMGHELVRHDVYELETYEGIAVGLVAVEAALRSGDHDAALSGLRACRSALATLRLRDIDENRHHRGIVLAAKEGRVSG